MIDSVNHANTPDAIAVYKTQPYRKLPLLVDSDNWTFLAGYLAAGKSDEEIAVH